MRGVDPERDGGHEAHVDPHAGFEGAQLFEAFALLDGYFFGAGQWARLAPAGGDQDRITSPLFQPPARGLWRDPRFDRLLERIGLSAYWRASGTVPDFRRAG